MSKVTDNGSANGMAEEVENLLNEDGGSSNALNRNELMNLTGKDLAKMAAPYSTLQLNSLERKSKAYLCDLILNKGDEKQEDDKPHARAARSKSDTEQFIDTAVQLLDVLKRSRDDEPLNAMAKDIFVKQAVVYADEKVAANEMNVDKANTAIFVISAAALIYDGVIGFKNTPALLQKVKQKFFKGKPKNETK